MRIPRLLRGILKTAVTWGIAWVPFSAAFLGVSVLLGTPIPAAAFLPILIRSALGGAINGAVFSVALAIAGRNKTPDSLSAPLLIACGAVGGAFFPALMLGFAASVSVPLPLVAVAVNLGIGALMGSAFAGVTLKAIRHAATLPAPVDASEALPASALR